MLVLVFLVKLCDCAGGLPPEHMEWESNKMMIGMQAIRIVRLVLICMMHSFDLVNHNRSVAAVKT